MILNRITLNNIRSYSEHPAIEFRKGPSLFKGDVGSGKSTITSAVEFALFGLGDQDGKYLLRAGEKTGSVLLEFEVDGKPYQVYRSLVRRRGTAVQDSCYIVENGVRTEYKPAEMKTRVLQILNFNEPQDPRAGSVIYRYAVFTPQETMKEVITQKPERRLETLRKAFRIEEYSHAAKNTSIFVDWLRPEIRVLRERTDSLGEKEENLAEDRHSLKQCEQNLVTSESLLREVNYKIGEIEASILALDEERIQVAQLQSSLPHLREQEKSTEGLIKETRHRIGELKQDLSSAEGAVKLLETLTPLYERYQDEKEELEGLEGPVERHGDLAKEKGELQKSIEKEMVLLQRSVAKQTKDLKALEDEVAEMQKAIEGINELEQQVNDDEIEVEGLDQISQRITELKQRLASTTTEKEGSEKELSKKRREWSSVEKIGLGAPCPRCKQLLTQEHYQKVEREYAEEISNLRKIVDGLETSHLELLEEVTPLEKKEESLKRKRVELEKQKKRLAALKETEKTLLTTQDRLAEQKQALENDVKSLQEGSFAGEERSRLCEVEKGLDSLEESVNRYTALKTSIQDLERQKVEAKYTEAKGKVETKPRVEQSLNDATGQEKQLERQLHDIKGQISHTEREYEDRKRVIEDLRVANEEKKRLESDKSTYSEGAAAKRKEIEMLEQGVHEKEEEVDNLREDKFKQDTLEQFLLWISDYFAPTLEAIERQALVSINQDFDKLFRKWFTALIETGDIEVRVDTDFTPLVEQNGYELDVNSLSGGERTSVALAYRLALNVLVKRYCTAMRSNLLILDEPTDGFSREQLFKLKDILSELGCEQVIMVSHEQELESFVDNIYQVVKEGGVSKVIEMAVAPKT